MNLYDKRLDVVDWHMNKMVARSRLDQIVYELEEIYGPNIVPWNDITKALSRIQHFIIASFMEGHTDKERFIDDASFLQMDNFRIIRAIGQKK